LPRRGEGGSSWDRSIHPLAAAVTLQPPASVDTNFRNDVSGIIEFEKMFRLANHRMVFVILVVGIVLLLREMVQGWRIIEMCGIRALAAPV
jgi:hypothetical protein